MLFFDTSAAIEWLRGNKELKRIVGNNQIESSSITIYELLWAAKRKNKHTFDAVELFLDGCVIISVDNKIARRAAFMKAELMDKGKDKPMADLLIAATAEVENTKFITFDNDFKDIANIANLNLCLMKTK